MIEIENFGGVERFVCFFFWFKDNDYSLAVFEIRKRDLNFLRTGYLCFGIGVDLVLSVFVGRWDKDKNR